MQDITLATYQIPARLASHFLRLDSDIVAVEKRLATPDSTTYPGTFKATLPGLSRILGGFVLGMVLVIGISAARGDIDLLDMEWVLKMFIFGAVVGAVWYAVFAPRNVKSLVFADIETRKTLKDEYDHWMEDARSYLESASGSETRIQGRRLVVVKDGQEIVYRPQGIHGDVHFIPVQL